MAIFPRLTLTVAFFLVAAALHPHFTTAAITAAKVDFPAHASSNLGLASIQLSGVIYYPSGTPPFPSHSLSAVVMMHGCGGMWSNGDITAVNTGSHFALPGAPNLQNNIEKWGIKFAQSGFVALAVDSYTKRRELPLYSSAGAVEWQSQCAADTPWNGSVDPYTERVFDLLAAYDYLALLPEINSDKIASLGWSQGAQSTMIEAAVTTPSGATRSSATKFIRNVSIYPGCGSKLKFGPTSNTVANSNWKPYRDMHLHVGVSDPFYADCSKRAELANSPGATTVVTFPTNYNSAVHSYDNTAQTSPPPPAGVTPAAEVWPTSKCTTMSGNECAMRSTDIDAFAFLQAVLT